MRTAVDAADVDALYRRLFDSPEGQRLPEAGKTNVREHVLADAVRAAHAARVNKQRFHRAGLAVYVLSPAAVAAIAAAVLYPAAADYFLWPHFVFLLVIVAIIWSADRVHARKKWVDARFLAERLRSTAFITVCRGAASPAEIAAAVAFVRTHWIADQIEFHRRTSHALERRSRRLERAGLVVFALALAAAAAHLIFRYMPLSEDAAWLEHPITLAALVLPGVGAAIGGFRAHREYSRLARRSEQMAPVLTALAADLDRVTDAAGLEDVLRRAEDLMLAETNDWVSVMRLVRLEAT